MREKLHEPIVVVNKERFIFEDIRRKDREDEEKHSNTMLIKFDEEIIFLKRLMREPQNETLFH